MNYRKVYCAIIEHAKSETRLGLRPKNKSFKKDFPNQYFEFHHILPRSLSPLWINRQSNIVCLTAREHFFCHQLLTKIYPTPQMFCALKLLATDNQNSYCSSKLYEKIRKECINKSKDYVKQKRQEFLNDPIRSAYFRKVSSETMKKLSNESRKKGIEKSRITCQSEEYRKRKSEQTRNLLESHPEYRVQHSEDVKNWINEHPEWRKKHSEQMKDKFKNKEYRKRNAEHLKNFKNTEKGKRSLINGGKTSKIVKQKSLMYKEYKLNGGVLSWNDFQKSVNININKS